MNDLFVHVLLYLVVAFAIVLLGSFYAEADDRKALRALPRRLAVFLIGSTVLAVVMLIAEHTLGSIS